MQQLWSVKCIRISILLYIILEYKQKVKKTKLYYTIYSIIDFINY